MVGALGMLAMRFSLTTPSTLGRPPLRKPSAEGTLCTDSGTRPDAVSVAAGGGALVGYVGQLDAGGLLASRRSDD